MRARMLNSKQKEFFDALHDIQNHSVMIALNENKDDLSLTDTLYNATFHAICGVMELIDGYYSDDLKLDLIERQSSESIKKDLQLHDVCVEYIKFQE